MIEPGFEAFAPGHATGRGQLVYTRLVADMETPVLAFLKLADGRDNAFLLAIVQGGGVRGPSSHIGLKRNLIWRRGEGAAEITRNALRDADALVPETAKPLESLRTL